MPNTDRCRLEITAPDHPEALLRFVDVYRDLDAYQDTCEPGSTDLFGKVQPHRLDKPCLTHAFAPMPVELREDTTDLEPAWLTWAVETWGTKWGTYNESAEYLEDRVVITFDSAWCPPRRFLETLATAAPELRFDLRWISEYDSTLYRWRFDASTVDTEPETVGVASTWSDDGDVEIVHYELDGTHHVPAKEVRDE